MAFYEPNMCRQSVCFGRLDYYFPAATAWVFVNSARHICAYIRIKQIATLNAYHSSMLQIF